MKGLIIKDLLNLSSYKTTLLIILIFCSIGMVGTDAVNVAPIFITVMIGMIVLSTFKCGKVYPIITINKKRNCYE